MQFSRCQKPPLRHGFATIDCCRYLRVFYEISSDEPNIVKILAVGYKKGNTLFIAGKAVKL